MTIAIQMLDRLRIGIVLLIAVGALAMLLAIAVPAAAQKRVALVIGVAAYAELPALHNPVSDARAIATLFETHGIATTVIPNPTYTEMVVGLARFRRNTEDADLALVYYAGHGLNLAGADVLLPSDTPARCDPKTREEALVGTVGIDEVIAAARPARNRVIILDACRTTAFPSCPSRGDATVAFRALGRVAEEYRGTLIATSAATGGVASDGPRGGHSPYNALLRQHLAGKPQSFWHEVLFDVNRELGNRPSGQQPSLHFAYGIPPAVCLKVEGCGQSPEEIENAKLRAEIEGLRRQQREQAEKQRLASAQVPAPPKAAPPPADEVIAELARKKVEEERRLEAQRKADEAKRAEALQKSREEAEKAKAQREVDERAAAEKKAADARRKAAEAAKAKQESERAVVAALPKGEKPASQGNFDGRWRSSGFTMQIFGNRPIKFYDRGRSLPLLNLRVNGNVVTFSIRSDPTNTHSFGTSQNYSFTLTFQDSGEIVGGFVRSSNQGTFTGTIRFSRV